MEEKRAPGQVPEIEKATGAKSVRRAPLKIIITVSSFIINESLRPALGNVREMCYRISDMSLCRIDRDKTYQ